MSEATIDKRTEDYDVPPLGAVMAYRGVHALSTIGKDARLKATHYATVLVGGREPLWGVWTVHGVFQRFFGSRSQVASAYPKLVWRKRSATWNLIAVHAMDASEKRKELRAIYHKGTIAESGVPVAALFEGGTIIPWGKHQGMPGKFQPLYAGPVQDSDNIVQMSEHRQLAAAV